MKLCGESIPFDKSEAEDTSSRHTKYVCFTAITLSSPSLQSWSIVITTSCRSEEKIEEKLQSFKKSLNLKKHSVGLMFACCERLFNKGVEVSAFKKVFPNVCLYGLHGDGEIGLNTLNKCKSRTIDLLSIHTYKYFLNLLYIYTSHTYFSARPSTITFVRHDISDSNISMKDNCNAVTAQEHSDNGQSQM